MRRAATLRRPPALAVPADPRPEELRLAKRRAALLTLDRERRRERRVARGAAVQQLASAGRALRGELGLELDEPPPRGAAAEAERGPVPERVAPLLAQPIGGLPHASTGSGACRGRSRGRSRAGGRAACRDRPRDRGR